MDITPLIPQGTQIIQSYSNGAFRVSHVVFQGAVIVRPERTEPWLGPVHPANLMPEHFGSVSADVILVGCGATGAGEIPFSLRLALKDQGLQVEFMDTGAACRTYNVLMSEGRDVAALLMPYAGE